MILQINKYHKVEGGEAISSVKVEKATEAECYREALKQYYQLASNYCADETVIDWSVAIVNPKTMTVVEKKCYVKPDVPVEPTEEVE